MQTCITAGLMAATLAVAATPARADDFSGFYVGAHAGGTWIHVDYSHVETAGVGGAVTSRQNFHTTPSGGIGGFHAGLQRQFGWLLAGVEVAWTAQRPDDNASTTLNGISRTRQTEVGNLWSVAGRLGFAADHWLSYVKLGYASAELAFANTRDGDGAFLGGSRQREDGLLFGIGVEYALTDNWIVGLDWTMVDFGAGRHQQTSNNVPVAAFNDDIDMLLNQVTARVSYRFNAFGDSD